MHPLFRHPGIRVLRRAILLEARLQLTAISAMLLGSLVLLWWSFPDRILWTMVSLIATLLCLRACTQAISRLKTEDSRLFYILRHQPRRVVWVYGLVNQRMPFGLEMSRYGILYIKLLDGEELTVSLPAGKLRLVSKTLGRLLPHASIGYSPDRARKYKSKPELLIRNHDRA